MGKIYISMGLMSGTSLDGVDVSIIKSDGKREFSPILDRYFEYDKELIKRLLEIRQKLTNSEALNDHSQEVKDLEREVTLFHAKAVNETLKISKSDLDLIGFHGQTIFHDSKKRITKQLGDGNLLSQLTKKKVIYNFRQNDLDNGGQGAPLTPIFHNLLANILSEKYKIDFPINILNIGGIANVTTTVDWKNLWHSQNIYAYDIGPGNCLIDEWIRKNSKEKYDKEGLIAKSGKIDKLILNQALDNFKIESNYVKSLDINDFDIFFAKGLSLENGAATITDFTARLIADGINFVNKITNSNKNKWMICGGGRKNKVLLERIRNNFENLDFDPIDKYKVKGDFVESQAFAFLAIRSLQGMPISFPTTTRNNKFLTGGVLIENF